tara:strand:+ start:2025 stop:2204 length:180 start_codon:yes stop_codon:yes gene_type:complete
MIKENMEKTKEIKKDIKNNGKKEKLTIDKAMEILEREIGEDRIKLTIKQRTLDILKQID